MILLDREAFEVEIKGEPWYFSKELVYFPATKILIHWDLAEGYSFEHYWGRTGPYPLLQEDFIASCKDVYNMQSVSQAFDALKLVSEKRYGDGRHSISFEMRRLLNY